MWQEQAIELKLARLRDAQRIARMSRDLVEQGLPWSWAAPRVAAHIRSQDTNVLTAWVGEQFAGFAIMQFSAEHAHLNLFAVDPQYRRFGIGRKLLVWLEETARAGGIFTINLEVRANNVGGRAFYRALGYQEVRTIPGYYSGRETAIRMTHDLKISSPEGS
jgi:[ribosomal protein S18]-alanine N-acetyltransferase